MFGSFASLLRRVSRRHDNGRRAAPSHARRYFGERRRSIEPLEDRVCLSVNPLSPVFINELHYDNSGPDVGEAVEVAGPAGTDLTGWTLVRYNGSNGMPYGTDALSGTIPDLGGGFGVVSIPTGVLQNGVPDGIALVDSGSSVVEFWSYEGVLIATGGPAIGLTSTDMGVFENSATPVGSSLQLVGTGTLAGAFSWSGPLANTFGAFNTGQTFMVQNLPPDPPVDVDPAPNMVDEGAATGTPVGITAQATDPDGDTVTYSLTDDAGGRFQINSITGVVTVADGSLLDGPNVQTITVQADDGNSGTSMSDFEISVKNVDPTITSLGTDATLADKALPDETVTVDGSFFDPGVPDTHTATVDWGDGSAVESLTVNQIANTFTGDHEYTTGGIFTITVLVSDDEGAFDVETTTAVVTGVGLVDGTLYVIGTDGKDDVDIKLGSDGGSDGGSDEPQLKVKAKLDKGSDGGSDGGSDRGTDFFDVADVDRIVIQLCGGDDKAKIHKDVDIDAEIHGGDGKDKLTGGGGDDFLLGENGKDDLNGGRGNDIVSGGDGDDKLRGGSDGGSDDGFDILIGGFGEDDLKGGKGDDILIGGLVTLDMAMLNDVRDIWTDGSSYSTRVATLTDPGGLLEANVTVLDDAAQDTLKGDKGRDLFFAKLDGSDKDKVKDLKGDEDLFVLF